MRRLALLAALALACALPGAAQAARLTVVYDLAETVQELTASAPPPSATTLDPDFDNLFRQGPAPENPVLPDARVAGKAASGTGSLLTPSLAGLDGPGIAAVLRQQVDASGAHLVFVDELDTSFQGDAGLRLAQAMAILSGQAYAGGSYADRVHVYVRTIRAMLIDPAGWAPAWTALSRAGGVWLEGYTGTTFPLTPWAPELWLAWPRAFAAGLAAQGAQPGRLHVLTTSGAPGDQAAQWDLARTGTDPQAACAATMAGPGAYRLSAVPGAAAEWLGEFRRTFPAPSGTAVGCGPSPVLTPALAAALGDPAAPGLLSLEHTGVALPAGSVQAGPLVAGGAPATVTVTLPGGGDPFGVAGRLAAAGAPGPAAPDAFWARARPQLTASGAGITGVSTAFAQGQGGAWTATLTLAPTTPGPVTLSLVIAGGAVRDALGPPSDLALSLAPQAAADPGLGPTLQRILADPLNWRLTVPLGPDGAPLAPALSAASPVPVLSGLQPSSLVAGTGPVTVTVTGTGLVAGSVARWNGSDRPTAAGAAAGSLTLTLSAADLAAPGQGQVTVRTPAPAAAESAPLPLTVLPPPRPAPGTPPRVRGRPRLAAVLSCTTGTWTGGRPTRLTRAWLRAGRPIPRAAAATHRVTGADLGRRLACRVRATNAGGTGSATSAPVAVPLPRLLATRALTGRAGRPLAVPLAFDAPVAGARVALRTTGARPRTVAATTVRGLRGRALVRLPRGTVRLRPVVRVAGVLRSGPVVRVTVR